MVARSLWPLLLLTLAASALGAQEECINDELAAHGPSAIRIVAVGTGRGFYAVSVGPDGAWTQAPINTAGNTFEFTVINAGTCDDFYGIIVAPSGAVTSASVSPTNLWLPVGGGATVTVTYSVGAAASGGITVNARGSLPASDDGTLTVTTLNYVSVTPDDGGAPTRTANSGGYTETFTVWNSRPGSNTYSFTCSGAGGVTCGAVPAAVTLLANEQRMVAMPYSVAAPGSGTLGFTASGFGANDAGSYSVPIVSYGVSTTPDEGTAPTRTANTGGHSQSFTVVNMGSEANTFSFTCSGVGGVTCGTVPAPVTVAGDNSQAAVSMPYSVGTPGTGTLTLTASGTNASDAGSYSVPIVSYGVAVTPDVGAAPTRTANTGGHSQTFTVTNTGSAANTFSFSCSGVGGVMCGTVPGAVSPAANGGQVMVNMPYSVGPPGTGTLTLTASGTNASDPGSYSVPIVSYGVAVTPDGPLVTPQAQSAAFQAFTVENMGSVGVTYNLTVTCTGAASACNGPASVTVQPSTSGSATVTYQAGSAGTTGRVRLLAVQSGEPTVTDSGWVDVAVAGAATPIVDVASVNPSSFVERELCLTIAAGAGAASECGDLRLVHALPTTRTLNKPRMPTLLYNTAFAHPYPLVAANVTLPNGTIPDSVVATLRFGTVVKARGAWLGSSWSAGTTRRIVVGYDGLADATGIYAYSLEVVNHYPAGVTRIATVTDELAVVNRKDSPFGAGWWLAGLEEFRWLPDGRRLVVGGDGTVRVYAPVAGYRFVAANPSRPDTLDGSGIDYFRLAEHGVRVQFSGSTGKHVATINRLGHVTVFNYDETCGRLSAIKLPPDTTSRVYIFTYTSATDCTTRLASVTAPPAGAEARVTTLTVTAGRVIAIRDPDLNSVGFGYDPAFLNRINTRTDRRGNTTFYAFDVGAKVAIDSLPLGIGETPIVQRFRPLETLGLTAVMDTAAAYTRLDGPRVDVSDTATFWLDRFGAPRRIANALGHETLIKREDTRWPALATEVRSPNAFLTRATYDARGNVLTTTAVNPLGDGRDAVTRYHWDPQWDFADSTVSATGVVTTMAYDANTGNRLWQQLGSDPARRVTFRYGNSLKLVSSTVVPLTPPDSIEYDALGNVFRTRTPLTFTTTTFKDNIGRDTLIWTPLDVAGQRRVFQKVRYDVHGQDTLSITFSDSTSDSVLVRKHFDAEGNVDSVLTRSGPDLNTIGWITRVFTYDRANRQTSEALVGSYATFPFRYDPAGNLTNGGRSGGDGVAVTYDVLNRPIRRQGTVAATFTYDAMGNLLTANNPYARITRAYFPNGALQADTSRLSAVHVPDSNFTLHVYGQRFTYDLSGRRTVAKHPSQLVTGGDSVAYIYDPVVGQLETLRDPGGNLYRFRYDLVGRTSRLTRLIQGADSVYEVLAYDADSRLARRVVSRGPAATLVRRDSTVYDARNRALHDVYGPAGEGVRYTPLGPLAASAAQGQAEWFWVDGLGNRFQSQAYPAPPIAYHYQPGSGRLLRQGTMYNPDDRDSTFYSYEWDGAIGQTDRYRYWVPVGSWVYDWELRVTWNTYDVERRLVRSVFVLDSSHNNVAPPPGYQQYQSEETYRYDALGRRVYTRVIRGPNCQNKDQASGCLSTLTRTVWDGDQVLYEIRVPGESTYSQLEADAPGGTGHWGVMGYLHAGGIDEPLVLWKGQQLVQPHANWRGAYVQGTCPSDPCDGIVWFPAANGTVFGAPPPAPYGPPSWHGSLIEGGQDASGYKYRRNRYLDPGTGRFTQEDPIGLAGGLNLYGFANGDPVNFGDPFGLQGCEKGATDECKKSIDWAAAAKQWLSDRLDDVVQMAGGVIDALTPAGDIDRALTGKDFLSGADLSGGQRAGAGLMAAASLFPGEKIGAGLARGIAKTIGRAQGAEVAFSRLGRNVRGVWEVAGERGAGYARWNRILSGEGSTIRLFKDVFGQGGEFIRRDWYVGGPR